MWLRLRFGQKLQLPTEVEVRLCQSDNFLFVVGGCQSDYDEYYATVSNVTYHQEVSGGVARSPISKMQCEHLVAALDEFFATPRKVLDFGCGEASLLIELATKFPSSTFVGFEPGPAAQFGSNKAKLLGLENLEIGTLEQGTRQKPFDLVILSHVMEHVLNFDLIDLLGGVLTEGGLLYIEVPNSLQYETHKRLEFLYYFDRLHVNHFTAQSLAGLAKEYGFGYSKHFEYSFPYRDGGEYPALGMLLRKGETADIVSPSIIEAANRYRGTEEEKARCIANTLNAFDGVLVWGAGDNFYRSTENGGPLSNLHNIIVLDRKQQRIVIGDRSYQTTDPQEGIRSYPWPVAVTVSEGRSNMSRLIAELDPNRRVFMV
jgi:2-polyprenyl-3-methyl-5-hydroxy-6-metoxy-1,4-benzoquinol methylase